MFKNIIKLSKKAILNEFRLKETPLVNGAVEETRKTNAPEEVRTILVREEILLKVASKVAKLFCHLW
jgi:hypothetical protein